MVKPDGGGINAAWLPLLTCVPSNAAITSTRTEQFDTVTVPDVMLPHPGLLMTTS